jgi:hypothetical protein
VQLKKQPKELDLGPQDRTSGLIQEAPLARVGVKGGGR